VRFFLKLFFSFWFALMLIGGLIAWTANQLRNTFERELPAIVNRQLDVRLDLKRILLQEGEDRLREVLSAREDREEFMITDDSGRDLLGRSFPQAHEVMMKKFRDRHVFDPLDVTGGDGRQYRLWIHPPRPSLLKIMTGDFWLVLLMVLSSGLTVFFLALHFTKPIQHLRKTTLRLAAGDLGARYASIPRRIPDELSALGRDFNFMAERLEHLFNAHKQLIRDISHELRSPLARMRVALELIPSGDERSRDNLDQIGLEVERLDTLIGQILTLSRYESLPPAPPADWIDIIGLIEAVVVDVRYEAVGMARRVEMDLCEEVIVRADGPRLRSALENVIRNALHHTPPQGGVLITVVKDQKWTIITVQDEGVGVPEGQLEMIFLPFFRVDEGRDRGQGGFGLGLAIAYQVIRQHGGVIAATNRLEGGLMVNISLPIAETLKE